MDDARLLVDFPFYHMAEHAFSVVIVVAQRLVQPMPNLAGNHRGRYELGMRMLQAGAGIEAVVLEDGHVVDAAVHAEAGVAFLVDAQNAGHLFIRQQSHAA